MTAAVRDRKGQAVRNLTRADFEVLDSGAPTEIKDFYTGDYPISLAVLIDISGSMAVGGNIERAREALSLAAAGLRPGFDEAAIFAFDAGLHRMVEFTSDVERFRRIRLEGHPWGTTSLYDSIAGAAEALSERPHLHRAVLVVTDGVDLGSRLTPQEVSTIASSIDVPVYVLVVATPVDQAADIQGSKDEPENGRMRQVTLEDLARWTGGDTRVSSSTQQTAGVVQDLFTEIRHRYLITFDPNARAGWHAVQIRTRNRNLVVRSRGWYRSSGR
jgi:Ca-activated chloride channel family protein